MAKAMENLAQENDHLGSATLSRASSSLLAKLVTGAAVPAAHQHVGPIHEATRVGAADTKRELLRLEYTGDTHEVSHREMLRG